MCGIVGYVGQRDAAPVLLPALRRLEYRGYDSAGIATVDGGRLIVRKTPGKIATLEASIAAGGPPPVGRCGIAHTRWATHGRPTDANAHPHVDCDHRVAIVHNGIIENYRELRRFLSGHGHRFRSQTDTEVVCHLLEHRRADGLAEAVRQAGQRLEGAYAIACIAVDEPNLLVAARRGSSPLVIGYGEGEVFLASDISALLRETRQIVVVGDGEIAVIGPADVRLARMDGVPVRRPRVTVSWNAEAAEKGGYAHFMLKEIFSQPEVIRSTVSDRVDPDTGEVRVPELGLKDRDIAGLNRLCFLGCGTSWHAALVGKYLVEELARLPVEVDLASEFRYRHPVLDGRMLTVPISQSGETADTLAALRCARDLGSRTVAICNVVDSALAREADGVLYTRAGLEIGVASTKAFTAQLAAVTLLAIRLGQARGLAEPELIDRTVKALCEVPDLMASMLEQSGEIRAVAELPGGEPELSLPGARPPPSARPRGGAQAEGDLVHPRRGLRRRRDEARADRPHRPGHPDRRPRAARADVREDGRQHRGGQGAGRHRRGHRHRGRRGRGRQGGRRHHRAGRALLGAAPPAGPAAAAPGVPRGRPPGRRRGPAPPSRQERDRRMSRPGAAASRARSR